MNILRTSFLTALASGAKLVAAFIVMKFVAVLAGPSGVAQLGQLMSLVALVVVFAGGGINPGVIKYLSEYKEQAAEKLKLLNTSVAYLFVTSLLVGAIVFIYSRQITQYVFSDTEYEKLVILLAFVQFFIVLSQYLIAIFNGMMDVKRLALVHIVGAIINCSFTLILGVFYKLNGALFAFILGQGLLFFVSFTLLLKSRYFSYQYFLPIIDWAKAFNLSKFSIMTLTSALLLPIVQLYLRNYLSAEFGWIEVGYWQAVNKVSDAYLLFITMAISVYYLPILSATNDKLKIVSEIKKAYIILLPLVCVIAGIIFLFREDVTLLLFSSAFSSANDLYAPQLIGDVIKISSFLLSYLMLAKAMTKLYVFSELLFSLSYIILVVVMTKQFGLIGAMYAFAVNYFFYLIFTFGIFRYFTRELTWKK